VVAFLSAALGLAAPSAVAGSLFGEVLSGSPELARLEASPSTLRSCGKQPASEHDTPAATERRVTARCHFEGSPIGFL
jgi:hypothetical protein